MLPSYRFQVLPKADLLGEQIDHAPQALERVHD
jgi:hypothetical protein